MDVLFLFALGLVLGLRVFRGYMLHVIVGRKAFFKEIVMAVRW